MSNLLLFNDYRGYAKFSEVFFEDLSRFLSVKLVLCYSTAGHSYDYYLGGFLLLYLSEEPQKT